MVSVFFEIQVFAAFLLSSDLRITDSVISSRVGDWQIPVFVLCETEA